jgi:hypothetical protein
MDIQRTAPPSVLALLRAYDAKLGARWDPIARNWEITRRSPVIVHQADTTMPVGRLAVVCERRELAEAVLTWPHWELTSSVLNLVMMSDGWQRHRGTFLRERVIDPLTRQRVERAKSLKAYQDEGRREMEKCLARDTGRTTTVRVAGRRTASAQTIQQSRPNEKAKAI